MMRAAQACLSCFAARQSCSRVQCYTRKPSVMRAKNVPLQRIMKISKLEFIPVSVPYTHREVSSLINRDGVTDIIVKATTDDGLVGWGESCSGADVRSVLEALRAMSVFVMGRNPWESEGIRQEL